MKTNPQTPKIKRRKPTIQELINALIKIIVAYELLLYAKQEIHKIVENKDISKTLKGWLVVGHLIPIGSLIAFDPLLSQHRDRVYEVLAKMLKEKDENQPTNPKDNTGR